MENNGIGKLFEGVDRWTVLIYVLIVLVGFVAILSASYEEGAESIFSFSHFYMKQLVWMGISFAVAVVVLLVDASIYHKWAYLFYVLGLLTLVAALLFGREVNGAKAWFEIGSVRIQPVEFAKIATALALARVMSSSSFSINRAGDLFKVGLVICLPLLIIVMQNDTGSGIVLVSLLFVLYREGLNKWLCIPVILIAVLFIFSFLFTPLTLLVMLILVCTLSEAMMNVQWRSRMVYLAALALGTLLLYFGMLLAAPGAMDLYRCLLVVTLLSLIFVAIYAFRANCSYRRHFESWFHADGAAPGTIHEMESYHGMLACVVAGAGIALIPRSMLESMPGHHQVEAWPLAEQWRWLTTWLVWRRGAKTRPLEAFIQLLDAPDSAKQGYQ